jgi:hypothetical protein
MSDEEMKHIWRDASASEFVQLDATALAGTLREQIARSKRELARRDRRELLAAAFLIPVFGLIGCLMPYPLSKAGAWLMLPSLLLILYVMRRAKRTKPVDATMPLLAYLQAYRKYLVSQMRQLQNVLYWYLLPVAIPLLLFFLGMPHRSPWVIGAALGVLVLVCHMNRQAAKHYFMPLIHAVEKQIRALNGEPD